MAEDWSRVWGTSGCGCSGGCPSSCYNFALGTSPNTNGNILDGFPLSIQTCGQAMGQFALHLQRRISAQSVVVTSVTSSKYQLNVRLDPKTTAIVTLALSFASCNYPITATYQKGTVSGTAKFMELGQLAEWLASALR